LVRHLKSQITWWVFKQKNKKNNDQNENQAIIATLKISFSESKSVSKNRIKKDKNAWKMLLPGSPAGSEWPCPQ
jgi:hypothetical protein